MAAALSSATLAAVAVLGVSHEVELMVNGDLVTVRSFASTVGGVLDTTGVRVGAHDYLHPRPETPLRPDTRIVVRHARPFTLTVDGRRTTHRVTANNVGDALTQLGLHRTRGRLSVPRTQMVPLPGLSVRLRTEREVTVVADGSRRRAVTTRSTVRGVLAEQRIRLRRGEVVRPGLRRFPRAGTVIEVIPAPPPPPLRTTPVAPEVTELNWPALAACESGGDPAAHNPDGPYYGLYQFSLPMWRAVGGQGTPDIHPAEEQTYRAQLLYQRVSGHWQGQWPHCGANLFR